MSYSEGTKNFLIFNKKEKKNSQLKSERLISYIEDKENTELYKSMEQGYKEMAHINLQYAEDYSVAEWYDTIEYETWLFGVW